MSGLNWDKPTTIKLLQIISDDPGYRHTLFGKTLYKGKENRKWVATRDLCVTLFQDEAGWIASMRKKGLLKRERGRWVATEEWTGRVNDPVKGLLNRLIKEMEDGFFVSEYGIDPRWTKWEDIPDRRKRDSFKRAYPHYFILHDLVSNHAPYRPLIDRSSTSSASASTSRLAVAVAAPTRSRFSKRLRSASPVRFEPYAKRGWAEEEEETMGEDEETSAGEEGMSWSNPVIVDSSPPTPLTRLASAGPGPSVVVARAKGPGRQTTRRIQLPSPSPTPSRFDSDNLVVAPSRPTLPPPADPKHQSRNGTRGSADRTRAARMPLAKSEHLTAEEVIIGLQDGNSSDESSISANFGGNGQTSDSSDSETDSEDSKGSFDFGDVSRRPPVHPSPRHWPT